MRSISTILGDGYAGGENGGRMVSAVKADVASEPSASDAHLRAGVVLVSCARCSSCSGRTSLEYDGLKLARDG